MPRTSGARVVPVLWFTAAFLAIAAALVIYARSGEIRWTFVAAAVFTAILGVVSTKSGAA